MALSLLLVLLVAFAGACLTYLVVREQPLLWRLAAGNVVGSAIWGLLVFIVGFVGGFTSAAVVLSLVLTVTPIALLLRPDILKMLRHDIAKAKGKLQGANAAKLLRFTWYLFFFIVFWLFFARAIYHTSEGIYTGGSQNLGDLPFHLGAIFAFTDGPGFPPQNPSWAGAKFSYPFMADLLTACLVKLGAAVESSMFVQNVSWAFSLLVILEGFVFRLTGSRLASRIAPFLLFFSGGIGFLWALRDFSESSKGLFEFLWALPHDYTIRDNFRWGNSMVVLFITQRSLLLGMPLTLLVLGYLWRVFTRERTEGTEKADRKASYLPMVPPLLVGLAAGTLPLIHLHSLAMLFVVTAFLFFFRLDKWREWIAFGVGVALIAVPELAWSMSGTATRTSEFIGWSWGWDKDKDQSIIWFWIKNSGVLIPMILTGLWLLWRRPKTDKATAAPGECNHRALLWFYIPFAFLFLVCNVLKFAPWGWDNIKILIYWYFGSLPIIALVLAWLWEKGRGLNYAAIGLILLLTASGALDVWRTITGVVKTRVFDRDAANIAEQLKQKTDRSAMFLNAPTYNSAVVLTGRQSLMRYSGHLSSYGIDYFPRENDVRRMYEGGGVAEMLLRNYNIDYVLISPEERNTLKANEEYFKKYPVIAESGQYRVYKIK